MVRTPWGDSDKLRGRRLPPGRGNSGEAARDNQRERLFAAMVGAVAENGYEATRVADLIDRSGVSRKAFYEHFANKQDCFLETLKEILTPARAIVAAKMRQQGSWEERTRGAMQTFVEMLANQPAAARLCLVEAYAAGEDATRQMDEAIEAFEEMMQQAFDEQPERRGIPREITRALVGGIRKIVHTRLHRGTENELVLLLPELLDLGLSYRPPRDLREAPRRRRRAGTGATEASGEEPLPTARPGPADPAERIVRATLTAVATKGYQSATIAEIAEIAGASLSTFYAHFDGKAEAFEAALYSCRARMIGVLLPVFRRARSWPEAVRAVTKETLDFLASEPEFTQLITVDVYTAGPEALERRDQAIEAAMGTLDGGLEHAPEMKPIVREAIMSSLYAMLCDRVQEHDAGAASLPQLAPLATYMALSPFIGAEEACAVVNGANPRAASSASETLQADPERSARQSKRHTGEKQSHSGAEPTHKCGDSDHTRGGPNREGEDSGREDGEAETEGA